MIATVVAVARRSLGASVGVRVSISGMPRQGGYLSVVFFST